MLNSFQQWAITYAAGFGLVALPYANWITINGQQIMSVDGLERFTS